MGRAAGEAMLLLPSQGLLNLPGLQRSAALIALQAHFLCPLNFSAPRGSGLCKISRPGLETAAAVHLLGTAKFWKLPWLCAKMDPAQRKRGIEEAM